MSKSDSDEIIGNAISELRAEQDPRNGAYRAMLDTPAALACLPVDKDAIRTARPGPNGTFGIAYFTRTEVVSLILKHGAALTGPEAQAKGWGLWIIDPIGDLLIEAAQPGTIPAFFIGGQAAVKGMERH